jgi:hypothetical protein
MSLETLVRCFRPAARTWHEGVVVSTPLAVSYAALWVLVVLLAVAVMALLRQIGVLHQRLVPMGTHFAGEGPELDRPVPPIGFDWSAHALTVLLFTSRTCVLCRELKPSLDAFRRQYREIGMRTLDLDDDAAIFSALTVRSTPYVVTVDRDGVVRGRGVANSLEQIEELVRESRLTGSASSGDPS